MTQHGLTHHLSPVPWRVAPGDIELPPTQPIDITALIAAELAARSADDMPST